MSLSETLASAESSMSSTEAPTTAATQEAPPAGDIATESTQPGLIGVAEEPEAPKQEGFKLADGVTPDYVVAIDPEGKPIKASDVQASFFRQSDYTRKTQEIAAMAKQFPQAAQWFQDNTEHINAVNPILQALQTGDQQALQAALQPFMDQAGVQKPRDAQGRFTKQTEEEELYDLDELEPDTLAYQMATRHNALVQRNSQVLAEVQGVKSKLEQFVGNVQNEQQRMQIQSELSSIASGWKAKGFEGDVSGAAALIGQPIGPNEAMLLHNYEAIMRHNLGLKGNSVPSVPAAQQAQPNVSPAGKSLAQFFAETTR